MCELDSCLFLYPYLLRFSVIWSITSNLLIIFFRVVARHFLFFLITLLRVFSLEFWSLVSGNKKEKKCSFRSVPKISGRNETKTVKMSHIHVVFFLRISNYLFLTLKTHNFYWKKYFIQNVQLTLSYLRSPQRYMKISV